MSHGYARKRPQIRSFEREQRIRALIEAGLIQSADEVPLDAIPAAPEFVRHCGTSPWPGESRHIIATLSSRVVITALPTFGQDWSSITGLSSFKVSSTLKQSAILFVGLGAQTAAEISNRKKAWWKDI